MNCVLDIIENYPPEATRLLMNHIGTHDTPRILTRLGSDENLGGNREAQACSKLSDEQYSHAVKLLKLSAVLQYTLVGVPSLFYGDEAGITGWGDPFCRATYPWGKEDTDLLEFYKKLGSIRRNTDAFKNGEFLPVIADGSVIAYKRKSNNSTVFIAVNRGAESRKIALCDSIKGLKSVLGKDAVDSKLVLNPFEFAILIK